jgi:hypothetical protein
MLLIITVIVTAVVTIVVMVEAEHRVPRARQEVQHDRIRAQVSIPAVVHDQVDVQADAPVDDQEDTVTTGRRSVVPLRSKKKLLDQFLCHHKLW